MFQTQIVKLSIVTFNSLVCKKIFQYRTLKYRCTTMFHLWMYLFTCVFYSVLYSSIPNFKYMVDTEGPYIFSTSLLNVIFNPWWYTNCQLSSS